ncbi:MAG: CoA-binding protein [Chitinophagaceae bacterium]|nr:CoA-binding protein [Chitinophagaceae bacterium]
MKPTKKTLVIGASDNPERYSYKAMHLLKRHGHPIIGIGKKAVQVADTTVQTGLPELSDIDTVTLYVNPLHQEAYYNYILSMHPKRVIFNPGTENPEFEDRLEAAGIQAQEACTLVLLSTGQY